MIMNTPNIHQGMPAHKTPRYADGDATWAAILDFYRTVATDVARWRDNAAKREQKTEEAA